jgi:hypothetical protein
MRAAAQNVDVGSSKGEDERGMGSGLLRGFHSESVGIYELGPFDFNKRIKSPLINTSESNA